MFEFENLEDFVDHIPSKTAFTADTSSGHVVRAHTQGADMDCYVREQFNQLDLDVLTAKGYIQPELLITCPNCGSKLHTLCGVPLEAHYCLGCRQLIPDIHFQKQETGYVVI